MNNLTRESTDTQLPPPLPMSTSVRPRRRTLRVASRMLTLCGAVAAVLALGYFGAGSLGWGPSQVDRPLSTLVRRATLKIIVTERGNLESVLTVDGVCQLTGMQNKIIQLVPEGTKVKKGEIVCRFESAEIDKNIAAQEIKAKQAKARIETQTQEVEIAKNKGESEVTDAEVEYKLAVRTLEKYEKSDFPAEVSDLNGQVSQDKSKAEEARVKLEQTRDLVKKGFRSQTQLQGAQTEYDQFKFFQDRDEEKLEGKKKYEYSLKQLELSSKAVQAKGKMRRADSTAKASVSKAVSEHEAAAATFVVEDQQLKEYQKQKELTILKAEQDGVVAYANDRYWDESSRVREGALVYSRQRIFSLPDMSHMQVKVNIHESLVKKVKAGQVAEIRVDAFPNLVLRGLVKSVSQLADSNRSFLSGGTKEYATLITIEKMPEDGLRPAMTAEVQILVNVLRDVLVVPVQAVVEHKNEHFAYVENQAGIRRRLVKIGDSNEKQVQILEGLVEGERVLLDARSRADVEFKGEMDKEAEEKTTSPAPTASPNTPG